MPSKDQDADRAQEQAAYRDLWGAVVLQARSDIQSEPLQSLEFASAVAFFTGGGDWVHTRTTIADFLELHRDDLEKMGRRCINERRSAEGLAPLPPRDISTVRGRPPRQAVRKPIAPMQAPAVHTQLQSGATVNGRFNPFFPNGLHTTHLASGA